MSDVFSDDFWINQVRKLGSNHASDAFGALADLIGSGRLTERELRSLASACRSLEGAAKDAATLVEAKRRRPWEFQNVA